MRTNVKIFTDNIEGKAYSQVYTLAKSPAFEGAKIRIMPDVHAGAGCVIGFTADLGDKVIPNVVGVDIGCGVLGLNLGQKAIDLKSLDTFITHFIPNGFNDRKEISPMGLVAQGMIENLKCLPELTRTSEGFAKAIGSLGGGNHFIEIGYDEAIGDRWLLIHSGSRNLGHQVASYYQRLAKSHFIKLSQDNEKLKGLHKDLYFLDGELAQDYLHDMRICQEFAYLNRLDMASDITQFLSTVPLAVVSTVHNYIGSDNIVRKGAISALDGENVLIPMNMRDGTILAVGKGNEDWNNSAPHGAGRIMSRGVAKRTLDMEEFEQDMEEVYTTSVVPSTLDESPRAYKPMEEVVEYMKDTVIVKGVLKPIYNFKAK